MTEREYDSDFWIGMAWGTTLGWFVGVLFGVVVL